MSHGFYKFQLVQLTKVWNLVVTSGNSENGHICLLSRQTQLVNLLNAFLLDYIQKLLVSLKL